MVKIYKQPFAHGGDAIAIPSASQPDGKMSSADGWTPDYQLPSGDPNYKPVDRQEMNGVFKEVTEAIGDIQLSGIAKWSADAAPYPAGALVWHDSSAWSSTSGNNNSVPGSGQWLEIATTANATEALRGVMRIGTQVEVRAGALDNVAVTPKKMRWGFSVSLSTNGYIVFPSWLGGLVLQWGSVALTGSMATANFPIAHPNKPLVVLMTDFNSATASTVPPVCTVTQEYTPTSFKYYGWEVGGNSPATSGAVIYFSIGH